MWRWEGEEAVWEWAGWGALAPVRALSTSRLGGVSVGSRGGLNLGAAGDEPWRVAENWRRVGRLLGLPLERQVRCRQEHGTRVIAVTGEVPAGRPEDGGAGPHPLGPGDALITDVPGIALHILTADCVPILLLDPDRPAVGVVHAGWRGTLAGVVTAAARAMARAYGSRPGRMRAALGPCIGSCCYEVDEVVIEPLRRLRADWAEWAVLRRPGHWLLDLPGLNRILLAEAGLPPEAVLPPPYCTLCRKELFFSHRGEAGQAGRFTTCALLLAGDGAGKAG